MKKGRIMAGRQELRGGTNGAQGRLVPIGSDDEGNEGEERMENHRGREPKDPITDRRITILHAKQGELERKMDESPRLCEVAPTFVFLAKRGGRISETKMRNEFSEGKGRTLCGQKDDTMYETGELERLLGIAIESEKLARHLQQVEGELERVQGELANHRRFQKKVGKKVNRKDGTPPEILEALNQRLAQNPVPEEGEGEDEMENDERPGAGPPAPSVGGGAPPEPEAPPALPAGDDQDPAFAEMITSNEYGEEQETALKKENDGLKEEVRKLKLALEGERQKVHGWRQGWAMHAKICPKVRRKTT